MQTEIGVQIFYLNFLIILYHLIAHKIVYDRF